MFLFSVNNPLVFYVECRIRCRCEIVQFCSIPLLENGVLDLDIFWLAPSIKVVENRTGCFDDWVSQRINLRGDAT